MLQDKQRSRKVDGTRGSLVVDPAAADSDELEAEGRTKEEITAVIWDT